MTLFIQNSDLIGAGVQRTLGDSDQLIVMAGTVVGRTDIFASSDSAVLGSASNNLVEIYGAVVAGGVAISLGVNDAVNNNHKVVIAEGGLVRQTYFSSGAAIRIEAYNSTVINHGGIVAKGNGLVVGGSPAIVTNGVVIENSGTISGENNGIRRNPGSTGWVSLTNTGTIYGENASYDATISNATDNIHNSGTMDGDVLLGEGSDLYDGLGGGIVLGTIFGGDGVDAFNGGPGTDRFDGGAGADGMSGNAGNDFYTCDASDTVFEQANKGLDMIRTTDNRTLPVNVEDLLFLGGNNTVGTGNTSVNTITGNTGSNTLFGLAANDVISGKNGNDFLVGGIGADRLTGGLNADRFIFSSVTESRAVGGRDTIVDFSRAEGDKIQLSAIDASTKAGGNNAFVYVGGAAFSGKAGELRVKKIGTDVHLYGDVNGDKIIDLHIISDVPISFVKGDFIL